jgi:hypothetical protein
VLLAHLRDIHGAMIVVGWSLADLAIKLPVFSFDECPAKSVAVADVALYAELIQRG